MTREKFKPSERFRANMKKFNETLKDIDKEMKESNLICSILLSIVISPKGSTMGYEYLHTFGDIDRNLQIVFAEYMKELRALNQSKAEKTH